MDQVAVAAGVSVRFYDVALSSVRGLMVGGGVGKALGFELPRGKGVLQ